MRLNRSLSESLRLRASNTEFSLRPSLTLLPLGEFQTVLLTAMNVYDKRGRAAIGPRFGLQGEGDYEAWFLSRMDMFMEVTVASVQAMSVLPETWMLFVDDRMPDFAEQLRRRVAHIPYAAVCPVPRPANERVSSYYYRVPMAEHIAKRLRKGARSVMTTLLDNDDCLHRDYIRNALLYAGLLGLEDLRSAHIINFPYGLKWNRDFVYPMTLYSNPYMSFVEPAEWYKNAASRHLTGYQRRHGALNQCATLHDIPLSEPMWLRQYHETNTLDPVFDEGSLGPLENIRHQLGHFGLAHIAPPEKPYGYALAAGNLRRAGARGDALTLLKKAQALSPGWAVLEAERAALWEAEGNFAEALAACGRWVELSGGHPFALFQAGRACLRMGEFAPGRKWLEQAFARQPGLACESVALAAQVTDALLARHPDWAWAYFQQGLERAQRKKHSEAQAAFQKAMQLSPSWPDPYYAAAIAAFDAADDAAIPALAQKGLALRPLWPPFYHLLGKSHMRQRRWGEAAEALLASTGQDMDQGDPNYDLAECLVQLDRMDEAEISIGDALLFDGEHVARLHAFARLLKERGHKAKAAHWANMAQKLMPGGG